MRVDPLQANCIARVPLPPVKEQVSNLTVEPVKNPTVDKKENKKDDNKNEEREMQKDVEDLDVDVDEFLSKHFPNDEDSGNGGGVLAT